MNDNCNILYNMIYFSILTIFIVFSMADRASKASSKRPFMSFLLVFIGSFISMDSCILRSAAQSTYKIWLVIILLREKWIHLNIAFLHVQGTLKIFYFPRYLDYSNVLLMCNDKIENEGIDEINMSTGGTVLVSSVSYDLFSRRYSGGYCTEVILLC